MKWNEWIEFTAWTSGLDQWIKAATRKLTRMTVHLFQGIFVTWNGSYWCIMAHTYIAIIHLSNFHHIRALNLAAEIRTSLKARKTTKMIFLNTITTNLGTTMCKAMAPFCVFSGSDSTSFMFKVSDPAAWWYTVQLATIVNTQFQTSTRLKELATSFVCRLYSNLTEPIMFDLVRMRLFSQTTRDVERIPQLRILLINISKECLRSKYLGNSPHVYDAC